MALSPYTATTWANLPSTSTPITAAQLQRLDSAVELLMDSVVNALDFGALNTNTGDQSTALETGAAAAISQQKWFYIPAGTYRVTRTPELWLRRLRSFGDGIDRTIISQATANTPVVRLGNDYQNISGMSFWMASAAGTSDSGAIGIELHKAFNGQYQHLSTFQTHQGIACYQGGVSSESSPGGITVTTKALTSNVATITTAAAHGLTPGQLVAVRLTTPDAVFDGRYAVASTPTGTTFTYARTNANVGSTAATGNVATDNYFFSCTFKNIHINGYRLSALKTLAVNAANTGSTFENLYTNNQPLTNASGPALDLQSCDEMVFNQVNVEGCTFTATSAVLNNGSQVVFNGLHFEGITCTTGAAGQACLLTFGSGHTVVDGMTVHNSTFISGGIDSVLQGGATALVSVRSLRWGNGNSVAASPFTLAKDQDTTTDFDIKAADLPAAFTAICGSTVPARLSVNNQREGFRTLSFSATPTPNTFDAGTQRMVLTGNITSVGVPTKPYPGAELTFVFVQDGTGGRTVAWNAIYKLNWTPTTTANKVNSVTFRYEPSGPNWVQVGEKVNV